MEHSLHYMELVFASSTITPAWGVGWTYTATPAPQPRPLPPTALPVPLRLVATGA